MAKHEFGGDWTAEKLERIRKYLCAYTTIFTSNPRARSLTPIYLDAFAGTGHRADLRSDGAEGRFLDDSADPDAESLKKGSARIALEVEPPFKRYVFIERREERVRDLEDLRGMFPDKAARVAKAGTTGRYPTALSIDSMRYSRRTPSRSSSMVSPVRNPMIRRLRGA